MQFEYRKQDLHIISDALCQISADIRNTDFAKYGVLIVELVCSSQREEKLTPVIMRASICHGNQTSSNETQSGVKFILEIRIKKSNLCQCYTC